MFVWPSLRLRIFLADILYPLNLGRGDNQRETGGPTRHVVYQGFFLNGKEALIDHLVIHGVLRACRRDGKVHLPRNDFQDKGSGTEFFQTPFEISVCPATTLGTIMRQKEFGGAEGLPSTPPAIYAPPHRDAAYAPLAGNCDFTSL